MHALLFCILFVICTAEQLAGPIGAEAGSPQCSTGSGGRPMEFEVSQDDGARIVRLAVLNRLTVDEDKRARDAAVARMRSVGYSKLLLDVRACMPPPGFKDMFTLAQALPRELDVGARVAIVLDVQEMAERSSLFALIAENRGAVALSVFADECEALAWLQSSR